ncbi:MAG: hypothetical protein KJ645_00820, partial [Planctomycetes bacterium]|nr:hypothetical protein [Planctomycetota bacterium]
MERRILKTGWLIVTLLIAVQASGKDETPAAYALRAGWIYTCAESGNDTPFLLKDAVLWVKDGRIIAIGEDIEIPSGTPIFDFSREVIMPGLVLADNALVPARGGRETISAKYHALDGFDPYADYRVLQAGGITTIFLHPGTRRLVSGMGAVVKV